MPRRPSQGSLLPAGLWTAVVVALLALPGSEIPAPKVDWLDKLAHAVLFAVHYRLLAPALIRRQTAGLPRTAATVASTALAAVMETVQLWIPGRGWEWLDLVAGLVGIAAAVLWLGHRHARLSPRS